MATVPSVAPGMNAAMVLMTTRFASMQDPERLPEYIAVLKEITTETAEQQQLLVLLSAQASLAVALLELYTRSSGKSAEDVLSRIGLSLASDE